MATTAAATKPVAKPTAKPTKKPDLKIVKAPAPKKEKKEPRFSFAFKTKADYEKHVAAIRREKIRWTKEEQAEPRDCKGCGLVMFRPENGGDFHDEDCHALYVQFGEIEVLANKQAEHLKEVRARRAERRVRREADAEFESSDDETAEDL